MTTAHAATSVFTPGAYPELTYVARKSTTADQDLRDALATKGQIASVVGPSKSGKTVLVERVAGAKLVPVSGAVLRAPEDFWTRVLDWLNVPASTTLALEKSESTAADLEASGGIDVAFVAKGAMKAKGGLARGSRVSAHDAYNRKGLQQVIESVAASDFVLLLDDFHYVRWDLQELIAQQCKEAARHGVKIVIACVPHREDDVIRANPDLRGRVSIIDLQYWNLAELEEIASKGFRQLNAIVSTDAIRQFAIEAAGSPQLMQAICLGACFELGVRETLHSKQTIDPDMASLVRIFRRTATTASYASLVDMLRRGPKERGQDRRTFDLRDGKRGDVYECILRAVKSDPAKLSFPYAELKDRVEMICSADAPRGVAIASSVALMARIANEFTRDRAIDWDEEREVLDIVDPYFLFYLRWGESV